MTAEAAMIVELLGVVNRQNQTQRIQNDTLRIVIWTCVINSAVASVAFALAVYACR